jgi:hypothetical protein
LNEKFGAGAEQGARRSAEASAGLVRLPLPPSYFSVFSSDQFRTMLGICEFRK